MDQWGFRQRKDFKGIRIKLWLLKKMDLSCQLSFKTFTYLLWLPQSSLFLHKISPFGAREQRPTGPTVFKMTVGRLIRSESVNLPSFYEERCLIFPFFSSCNLLYLFILYCLSHCFSYCLHTSRKALYECGVVTAI